MQFDGALLRAILQRQTEPVVVLDVTGRKNTIAAKDAVVALLDDTLGVGNRRRIRYVKPSDAAIASARRRTRDIKDLLHHDPRPEHVQRNTQNRGAKTWRPQPTRARTGEGGGVVTLFRHRNEEKENEPNSLASR